MTMYFAKLRRFAYVAGSLLLAAVPTRAVDYLTEVKPVFAEHCYRCHGSSQQKSELRLDTAASALKGGKHGPAFQPHHSQESLILKVLRGEHEQLPRMPYNKPALKQEEIALIAKWIDEGAEAPADEQPESAQHWAYVPPERPALPELPAGASPKNAIDYFIQARLATEGIKPSPEADKVTLLRRLSLDLTGLPPTPEEVDAFLADQSADAYEKQVERLLSSAHYGERWGRWWLDAARYGDSNGYSIDAPRQIWKYRDWVIDALNKDMPFDQFAVEQLAGDLLPQATIEQKIATGLNRNTQINQEGGIDPEQFRVESVIDRVNTFGTVFLGLTIACAQCHDHKFDAVSQREYYELYAFFNNTVQDGHGGSIQGVLEVPNENEDVIALEQELEEASAELERYLDAKGGAAAKWQEALSEEAKEKLPRNVRSALSKPWDKRSLSQKRAVYAAFDKDDEGFKSRNDKVTQLEKKQPRPVTTLVMQELEKPRETHLLIKGDFTRPGEVVTPGVPAALHPLGKDDQQQLNRLDLARWVVDPANPLIARVIVNRIWQQYFGKGLVETENDFGTQGIPPTHPDLLDWLAVEFMQPSAKEAKAWSLKHIHRLIVNSATYRQSSRVRNDLAQIDANNRLLARQNRLRLDAEVVRDVALSASGLLAPQLGGPPVFPPQPDGVMSLGQVKRSWNASKGANRYRRAIYTHFWRATPHPALAVFDAPDGFSTCTRRIRSNTPLQALTLLNDQQFYEFAHALAERVLNDGPKEPDDRIEFAFRLCLAREPAEVERARLKELLDQQLNSSEGDPAAREQEAWLTMARVLLNLDETITRE